MQARQLNAAGETVTVSAHVNALAFSGSTLYAGGDFTLAGGNPANRVAVWNGTSWTTLGSGANDIVYAIGLTPDYLYLGGEFNSAGGAVVNGIARWKR